MVLLFIFSRNQTTEVRKCNTELNDSKNNLSKIETERKMGM